MNRAIEVNRLKPVLDRVFPFEEAVNAFRYYQAGQFFGILRGRPIAVENNEQRYAQRQQPAYEHAAGQQP